jgi:hypothetical protein
MDTLTSPLLATTTRRPGDADTTDTAATDAELTALIDLALDRAARTITIGSGRTPLAVADAAAIAVRWEQAGGSVRATGTWPETVADGDLSPARVRETR